MFMVHFSPMLNIYSYNKGQCKVKLSHVGKYNFCILIAWPRMDHIAPSRNGKTKWHRNFF